MKQYPMLFSRQMVRALLAGKKRQTRRLAPAAWRFSNPFPPLHLLDGSRKINCGDQVWVREAWSCNAILDPLTPRHIITYPGELTIRYEADGSERLGRYRAARFMPLALSRLYLMITAVRLERIQAITEFAACWEGADCRSDLAWGRGDMRRDMACEAVRHGYRADFERIWRELHGDEMWDENPWVWVYEFEPRKFNRETGYAHRIDPERARLPPQDPLIIDSDSHRNS